MQIKSTRRLEGREAMGDFGDSDERRVALAYQIHSSSAHTRFLGTTGTLWHCHPLDGLGKLPCAIRQCHSPNYETA